MNRTDILQKAGETGSAMHMIGGGILCRVTDSTGAVSEYTYNSSGQRTVVRNKIREDVWQVALKQHIWQEMYTYMELLLMEETKCQKEVIHLEWMIMVI